MLTTALNLVDVLLLYAWRIVVAFLVFLLAGFTFELLKRAAIVEWWHWHDWWYARHLRHGTGVYFHTPPRRRRGRGRRRRSS